MSRNPRKMAPLFAALGDPLRLRIIARLAAGEVLSIAQLTDGEGVTRQAVTKHLEVLAAAHLVCDVRRGRERLWQLDPVPLDAARGYLEIVSAQWDRRLARLKALVED